MEKKSVGVVGLGYVGLPVVAAFAKVGCKVVGLDIDDNKIRGLQNTYQPTIYEPGLAEALQASKDNIIFTTDYGLLMRECHAILITVGTPVNEDGVPDHKQIDTVITNICRHLQKGHLIILKSTVIPGTTQEMAAKLEKMAGLKAGKDFYFAFCPERTIEGLALHELFHLPKIIGGINAESTRQAAEVFKRLGGKIIEVSSPKVAEICKLADNLYRAMNIALGNEIGCLCESLGIDAYEVTYAVNSAYDRTNIFAPGLGADGPCLSKDPILTAYCGKEQGVDTGVTDACIAKNKWATLRIASIIADFIKENQLRKPVISLIGVSFKGFPETDDIRGSPAVKIRNELQRQFKDIEFKYYDPIVRNLSGKPVSWSLEETAANSNVVVFLINHRATMNINSENIIEKAARPLLLVDCWHNLENIEAARKKKHIKVFRVGDGKP